VAYQRRAGDPPEGPWLPRNNLVENAVYEGKCRNANQATWKEGKFHYRRYKFGETFTEEIEHPEDDRGFDVFFPFRRIW